MRRDFFKKSLQIYSKASVQRYLTERCEYTVVSQEITYGDFIERVADLHYRIFSILFILLECLLPVS